MFTGVDGTLRYPILALLRFLWTRRFRNANTVMKDRSIFRTLTSSYTDSRTVEIILLFPTLSYRERFSVFLMTTSAPRSDTCTATIVVYKVTLALFSRRRRRFQAHFLSNTFSISPNRFGWGTLALSLANLRANRIRSITGLGTRTTTLIPLLSSFTSLVRLVGTLFNNITTGVHKTSVTSPAVAGYTFRVGISGTLGAYLAWVNDTVHYVRAFL